MPSGNSKDDPDSYDRLRQGAPLHQLTTDGLSCDECLLTYLFIFKTKFILA